MSSHPDITVPPPRGTRQDTIAAMCLVFPNAGSTIPDVDNLARAALQSNIERIEALAQKAGATIVGDWVTSIHDPREFSAEVLASFPPLIGGETIVRTQMNVTVPL